MITQGSKTYLRAPLYFAVLLFLTLDACVLAINYWISWQIEKDAAAINSVGRQRMLSQRMAKSTLLLSSPRTELTARKNASQEFIESIQLFDLTLRALKEGGETRSDSTQVKLAEVLDPEALNTLNEAIDIWGRVYSIIHPLIAEASIFSSEDIQPIDDLLQSNNVALLDLMNRLTTRMELASRSRTNKIRFFLAIAFSLALINFLIILKILSSRYHQAARRGEQLEDMVNQVGVGVCLIDQHNHIQSANEQAQLLFGRASAELVGKCLQDLLIEEGPVWRGLLPGGEPFFVEISRGEISQGEQKQVIVTLLNVTDRHRFELNLLHLAQHDNLTGLPNRYMLSDRFKVAIAQAKRQKAKVGVALLDLDGFKPINDQYGHMTGDQVLVEVARRLTLCARGGDTVARLGGDEFVCVFNDINSLMDLSQLVERFRNAIREPFVIGNLQLKVGASIGLAIYPDDAEDVESLLSFADMAMYEEKNKVKQDSSSTIID